MSFDHLFNCPLVKLSVSLIRLTLMSKHPLWLPPHLLPITIPQTVLLVIIIMVIYVVLTCRFLRTTGISPNSLLKFLNAEWVAKDVSSICWHLKPANQSDALKFIWSDWLWAKARCPSGVQLSILWPDVPWVSSFSPVADPSLCMFCLCCGTVKSANSNCFGVAS